MSFYTRFADTETTAVTVLVSDVLLGYNQTAKAYKQYPISALGQATGGSGLDSFIPMTTTTSSATIIPATPGSFVVTAAASNAAVASFMLSTPAAAGIVMNFFNSSSTSTFLAIMSESTVVNFFSPGATAGGSATMQFACSYQSFGIVSGFSTTGSVATSSSASWFVIYKSTGVYSS